MLPPQTIPIHRPVAPKHGVSFITAATDGAQRHLASDATLHPLGAGEHGQCCTESVQRPAVDEQPHHPNAVNARQLLSVPDTHGGVYAPRNGGLGTPRASCVHGDGADDQRTRTYPAVTRVCGASASSILPAHGIRRISARALIGPICLALADAGGGRRAQAAAEQ